nr:MAG TPA: hypothetical protein [Caudoviricetes sp.]
MGLVYLLGIFTALFCLYPIILYAGRKLAIVESNHLKSND